jgi:hypothetical protein
MGQMYAKILPNGDVTRCCITTSGDLGNIFRGVELLEAPQPCQADTTCPCFRAMLFNEEANWMPMWKAPEHSAYKISSITGTAL